MEDFLLRFAIAQAGTASTTGSYVDMGKGTNAQGSNLATTDLLGVPGFDRTGAPCRLLVQVSGSSGTPVGRFDLYHADDTAGTNAAIVDTVNVTADGEFMLNLLKVRKRFARLDYVKTTGTVPYNAIASN